MLDYAAAELGVVSFAGILIHGGAGGAKGEAVLVVACVLVADALHRLEVMLDFERTEQNLLLIGDWYTAKLYTVIRDEFYLEEWKNTIRSKLDNLEGIVETIQEHFALSFETLMDRLQLIGWVLLLIGYLYLYVLDAGWIDLAK